MTNKPQTFDITSPAFKRDPAPVLAEMRAAGPVVRARFPLIGETWLATSYGAVNALLGERDSFVMEGARAGKRGIAGLKWWMPRSLRLLADNLLLKDDPDHRRLRGLVDAAFHKRGIAEMRPRIGAIADRMLEDFAEAAAANGGVADLVGHVARPFPLAVICELLGIREADRPMLMRWVAGITEVGSPLRFLLALPGLKKLIRYLQGEIEACRAAPREGLISDLVQAEVDGQTLTDNEMLSMVNLLFIAGHETTVHLISGGVIALLRHPEQKARLLADRGGESSKAMGDAVQELLRWVCPVQMTKPRHVAADRDFHGAALKRGDYVMGVLAAANRDPAAFADADALDLTRHPNRHLSFGAGMHFCLGAQLARAEAEIVLEKLFTRWPELSLAVDEEVLAWGKHPGLRAVTELPVRLGPVRVGPVSEGPVN